MEEGMKHLGLRVDAELHRKLKYISEFEGRSMNQELVHLVHQAIREYEEENGKIEEVKDGN